MVVFFSCFFSVSLRKKTCFCVRVWTGEAEVWVVFFFVLFFRREDFNLYVSPPRLCAASCANLSRQCCNFPQSTHTVYLSLCARVVFVQRERQKQRSLNSEP